MTPILWDMLVVAIWTVAVTILALGVTIAGPTLWRAGRRAIEELLAEDTENQIAALLAQDQPQQARPFTLPAPKGVALDPQRRRQQLGAVAQAGTPVDPRRI